MINLVDTFSVGALGTSGDSRLHHVGMVVPSIGEASVQLERWLGLHEVTLPFDDAKQSVRVQFVHAGNGVFIELIEAMGSASPVQRFMEDRGGGLHHVAFEVTDFDVALRTTTQNGGRLVSAPWVGFEGRRLAFFMPRGLRLLIELVEAFKPSQ